MLLSDQQINIEKNDSKEFIDDVNKIITLMVFQFNIKEICFIKIKNWFDHKWLNFSGKSVVHFDSGGMLPTEASLNVEWREKITVPPFHPNRVLREFFVRKQNTGNKQFEKRLHTKKQSNDNIHNRIQNYTKDGLFVWYSSNSKINNRGSLMVYRIQEGQIETWYASFEKRKKWQILKSKGIELNVLNGYLK